MWFLFGYWGFWTSPRSSCRKFGETNQASVEFCVPPPTISMVCISLWDQPRRPPSVTDPAWDTHLGNSGYGKGFRGQCFRGCQEPHRKTRKLFTICLISARTLSSEVGIASPWQEWEAVTPDWCGACLCSLSFPALPQKIPLNIHQSPGLFGLFPIAASVDGVLSTAKGKVFPSQISGDLTMWHGNGLAVACW